MYIQFVKFESGLSEGDAKRVMEERAPQYRQVQGLLQKYYVHEPATGQWGGIYLWDSEASMIAFRDSELRRTIPQVYAVEGSPRSEVFEVVFPLREVAPEARLGEEHAPV